MNTLSKLKINNSVYVLILIAFLSGYIKHVTIIMCIIFIHELGHVFFATIFKFEVTKIEIYPFGGLTTINKFIHERIYKDILISIGGILFQIILLVIFSLLLKYNIIVYNTYILFTYYNKSIILFNLLPIIPLDGCKLINSILNSIISYKNSLITTIVISITTLFLFIIYNIVYKLNDIIMYIFLLVKLIELIKEYKYIINKFYLERIMYNHYYNKIIKLNKYKNLRLNKYYYIYDTNHYLNEKEYLKKYYF